MKKNTENIIFFFYPGRAKRLEIMDDISTEFFYSFIEAKESIENVKLIEVENTQNNLQRLMKFYDRIIFKICRIQSNSEKFCEKKYKDLLNPKNILIFTNFALGLSALPFLMKDIFRKRNDIFVINSGLFSFRKANSIQKLLRSIYLRFLFNLISKMIFTSKTEYLFAVDMFPKYENKFVLNEFCPDFRFWNKDANSIPKEKVDILFIGNDEGRYFELLEPLAEELSELKFTFITNNKEVNRIKLPNVRTISANWSGNNLSDLELLKIYRNSRITILPIRNKLVASGQSVALQSMCNKTPVMITNTIGFWNKSLFKNEENIIFVEENSLESWVSQLRKYYNNKIVLSDIAEEAYITVLNNYTKDKFDTEFLKLLS